MKIYVKIKQLGKIKDTIGRREYDLPFEGEISLRKFITYLVIEEVKKVKSKSREDSIFEYLSSEDIENLKNSGKISFGANYSKNYTENKAVEIAMESYEYGLYRVFQGNDEIKNLDDIISFSPECEFTFIKLTMLAGR